jgi:crossover junction endodeoxyribonuclease RuvC
VNSSSALSLDLAPAASTAHVPSVLALDLSLTATGWAKSDGSSGCLVVGARGYTRLAHILDEVTELAKGADLIVIESVFVGQKNQAVLDIAGLATLVRFTLWEAKYTLVDVAPSSLKMFATDSGNAPKDAVLVAAVTKLSYRGHDHNTADALWLLDMARAHYGGRTDAARLTAKQTQALAKIQWPLLTTANT